MGKNKQDNNQNKNKLLRRSIMAQPANFGAHKGITDEVKGSNDSHQHVLETVVDNSKNVAKQNMGQLAEDNLTIQMSDLRNTLITGMGNKAVAVEAQQAKKAAGN